MQPVERHIIDDQEEYELPNDFGDCWPIFHQVSIVEPISKNVHDCKDRGKNDAVKDYNANTFFNKSSPLFIVSFPRPRFLPSTYDYVTDSIFFKKGILALIDKVHSHMKTTQNNDVQGNQP